MLKNGTILMINEMALEGKSAYAISKALDISKATAAKYMAEPPKTDKMVLEGLFIGR